MPPLQADPRELDWPVHPPLSTADVVHAQVLYMHEIDGVDDAIEEGLRRVDGHIAGEVRITALADPAYPQALNEPVTREQIDHAYDELREYRLPSDILVLIVNDWDGVPDNLAALVESKPDGGHLVVLRAAMIDSIARFPLLSRHTAWRGTLQHEIGHVLGIPADRERRRAGHCVRPQCLMYHNADWRSITTALLRFGPATADYCRFCSAELRAMRAQHGVVPRQDHADYDRLAYYNDLVAINDGRWRAYNARALHQVSLNAYDEAVADYSRALEVTPDEPRLHYSRGNARAMAGDFAGAIADLERSLAARPDHVRTLYHLSLWLATATAAETRDGQRARELAERACELTDWQHPLAIAALAAAHAELGDFEQAIAMQKKAMNHPNADDVSELQEQLDAYSQHRPWRWE